MRRRHLRLSAVVTAVAAGLLLAGLPACSSGNDRLVVYSGRSEELIGPLLERFSEEAGVKIDVRYGDSADLALLIDQEGDASKADVFISQSPGAVGYLDQQERLKPLPADVVGLVPPGDRADDRTWVGLSGRVRVLVYNTDMVSKADLPRSVLDLTGDEYRGKVAVAPTNGSFIDFVTAMRSELGEERAREWVEGMADNDSPTYANNNAIVEAVGRGEVPMGLANHYYNLRAKDEDPDVPSENWYFPAEGDLGSLLIVTAASKLAGTDRDDDAEELVEFLLSDDAQRFFADETFEYPLVEGVPPLPEVPDLADLNVTRIKLDELGAGLRATQTLIDESGIAG